MHRGLRQLVVGLATLSLPGAASAVEVQPIIEGTASYTDNLFSSSAVVEDDFYFSIGPGMAVADEGGTLKWRLAYLPSYLFYTNFGDLNGWDHDVDGSLSWQITPRTTVRVADRFVHMAWIGRFNEFSDVAGSPAGIDAVGVRGDRNQFQRNVATFGLEHLLGRRTFLDASYRNSFLDFEDDLRVDRANQEAAIGLSYLLRVNLRTGVRLSWSQSQLKPTEAPDRTGNFYNASLTAVWTPSARTTLLASAGPTLVKNDATNTSFSNPPVPLLPRLTANGNYANLASCAQLADGAFFLGPTCTASAFRGPGAGGTTVPFVQNVGSVNDEDITFFANLNFVQEWDHWKLQLGYNRQDDQSVSSGVSGVVNVGRARLEYEPAPRWLLVLSAAYILRESTTDTVANVLTLKEATRAPITALGGITINANVTGLGIAESASRRLVSGRADQEIRTFRTFFSARYQLTERVRLNAMFFWTDEKREFNGNRNAGFERFTTLLGFTYEFAPIIF